MGRGLLKLQTLILAAGVIFSWTTLVLDYRRFFDAGGRALQFSQCIVANPLATPCFYGALAFLAAFVWSVLIVRSRAEVIYGREQALIWLLAAANVFAWGNFGYEVYGYVGSRPAPAFSCPAGGTPTNPLLAPCFYGAILYLLSLLVALEFLRREPVK